MLLLISPAKTLDYQSPLISQRFTQPEWLEHAAQLIAICRQFNAPELARLMKISDPLATLNVTRFHQWQPEFTLDNARQALLAYKGDVYAGLNAADFSEADLNFAQTHLRILSGLYGLLRPLDLMQPYRLEMGTKLNNLHGKNLYAFWGDQLTVHINQLLEEQGSKQIINLASDEYFSAITPSKLSARLIKPIFLDEKNGNHKVISFYAKKARGLMSRFVIKQRLTEAEELKTFDLDGYAFSSQHSTETEWIFRRAER